MKTLGTAFKQVYGEALKEYGFKKIKGKYPYFVRLIGDEIVHVITYKEEWCIGTNYKAFVVLGGVATIYRKILTFEESPKNNEEWLISNAGVYCKLHPFSDDEEYIKKIMKFEYENRNEDSLMETIKYSWNITEKNILCALNETKSLKSCTKFFNKFKPNLTKVYADEKYVKKWSGGKYNEGLLNVKVYGSVGYNEYVEDMRNIFDKYNENEMYLIKTGISGLTIEDYKNNFNMREERLNELLKSYEKLVNDSQWQIKVEEELEYRKKANQAILQNFGLKL